MRKQRKIDPFSALMEIAQAQQGYFTTRQAIAAGYADNTHPYVGRLHRLHDSKREVIVYDYVDGCVPVFSAMYSKRIRGYEAVGYQIQDQD